MKNLRNNFIVGFFLAFRDIRRSNKWTTFLIIFIMTITFLNLVVVRGILIGLVSGANVANKAYFSSDVIITAPKDKTRIEGSAHIVETVKSIPAVAKYTQRYTTSGRLEAGYRDRIRKDEKTESVGALIPTLTAEENVMVPLLMQGIAFDTARKRAEEALSKVGLSDRLSNLPSMLSGGQQQRVSIARAIGHNPSVLFADEPTANLDTETSQIVLDSFIQLNKSGQTIVMVTHEQEYARLTHRTITLSDGVITNDTSPLQ